MSFSKRDSRKIVVDGDEFRWSPSQDSGYMVLVVQHSSGQGQRIEAIISDDNNLIVESGSYAIEVGTVGKLMITPSLVSQVIKDARQLGWNPLENAKPLMLFLDEESMTLRPRS